MSIYIDLLSISIFNWRTYASTMLPDCTFNYYRIQIMTFLKHKIKGTAVNGDIKRAVVLLICLTKLSSCHMEQQKAGLTNKSPTGEVHNDTTCAPTLTSRAWVSPPLFLTWFERIPNFSGFFCRYGNHAVWRCLCSLGLYIEQLVFFHTENIFDQFNELWV